MLGTWLRALYSHATLAVLSWRVGTRSRDADPEFALPPFLLDQPEPTKLSRIGRLLPLARFREYHRSLSVPMGDAWQRLRAELAWLVHGSHWSCIRFPEPRIRRALHGDRKQEVLYHTGYPVSAQRDSRVASVLRREENSPWGPFERPVVSSRYRLYPNADRTWVRSFHSRGTASPPGPKPGAGVCFVVYTPLLGWFTRTAPIPVKGRTVQFPRRMVDALSNTSTHT
jgi:hypothetical protein